MKTNLPSYLVMKTSHAAARQENTIVFGNVRFTVITPRLIRIEHGGFTDEATQVVIYRNWCECGFDIQIDEDKLTLTTDKLILNYRKSDTLDADSLSITAKDKPYFRWNYGDKPLQNLGGTTSTLDQVNGACAVEDGVCSVDGYSLIDDSASPLITSDGWFAPRKPCTDLYFFGYGHDYTACVQDYCRLTGGVPMLPAFTLGNWWSRYWKYTDKEYLNLMDRFSENDLPISVGIVDMDWHLTSGDGRSYKDGWTGYTWNKELFPDHRGFIEELHRRNIRTALNLHPASGIRPYEEMYERMAEALGKDPKSGKTIPCNCIDPAFLKAYFEVLHFPYEEDGVDFWWLDWQQGCDYRKILEDAYAPNPAECITPLWMLNHMHYLASKRNGNRGLIFSRFSGYGAQRYPIGFSGDTVMTWDSLDFQPWFTLTASNVGFGWWSHDIGGHMGGYKDDELTVRWVQFGVFSPIFRLHSTDSPFLGKEPWNYNPRAEFVLKDFMRLRHRLFPYLYTMNRKSASELIPLIRPMYHVYPESADAYSVKNQYWFGSEMIIAPITHKADEITGMGETEVWFPEGLWIDAFNGYVYKGDYRGEVYRSMEQMPVFLKAGALVPMQISKPNENTLGGSEAMELLVAPGADNRFTLYEDDGVSEACRDGHFCETRIDLNWEETEAELIIHPASGDTALIPEKRSWKLVLRGFRNHTSVTVNGKEIPCRYDKATHSVVIELESQSVYEALVIGLKNCDGLTWDNADCMDVSMDRIMRAQCTLEVKNRVYTVLKHLMARKSLENDGDENKIDMGFCGKLYGAIRELPEQQLRILNA